MDNAVQDLPEPDEDVDYDPVLSIETSIWIFYLNLSFVLCVFLVIKLAGAAIGKALLDGTGNLWSL